MHDAVAAIIDDVRGRGDAALLSLTAKFDNLVVANVSELAVSTGELNAALDGLNKDLRAALSLQQLAFTAFTKSNCRRTLPIRIRPELNLACAIRLLMRSGFMCRAARRPIHHQF